MSQYGCHLNTGSGCHNTVVTWTRAAGVTVRLSHHTDSGCHSTVVTRAAGGTVRCHLDTGSGCHSTVVTSTRAAGGTVRLSRGQRVSQYGCNTGSGCHSTVSPRHGSGWHRTVSPRHGQRVSQHGCHFDTGSGWHSRCHLDTGSECHSTVVARAAGVTVRLSPRHGSGWHSTVVTSTRAASVTIRLSRGQRVSQYGCHTGSGCHSTVVTRAAGVTVRLSHHTGSGCHSTVVTSTRAADVTVRLSPRHGLRVSQYGCHTGCGCHSMVVTWAAGVTIRLSHGLRVSQTIRLSPRPGQQVLHYGCHLHTRHRQFHLAVGVTHDLLQLFPEDAATHRVEEEVDCESRDVERANVALTRYHGNER